MYRTTTNCTTDMIDLNDMDQQVCDQDAEKNRNHKILWIIKEKEIDIAEGDKVLINGDVKNKQILSS